MNDLAKAYVTGSIISDIIDNTGIDGYIKELILDDYGQCIRVTIVCYGIGVSEIQKIGNEFGDDDPNTHSVNRLETELVFVNKRHEELYTKASSITLSINVPKEFFNEEDEE